MTVDMTPVPIGAVGMDLLALATVSMDLQPLGVVNTLGIFSVVEVPVFPELLTQDFLTSNGEFLTSDGEALAW